MIFRYTAQLDGDILNKPQPVSTGEQTMLESWQAALDKDYPAAKSVTERTIKAIEGQRRWLRGSVRLTMGRIVTDSEYRARRAHARKRPL